ncbi:MAG: NUDIX hydrolase [archaeon]
MPKPTNIDVAKYMFTEDVKFLQKALVKHPTKPGQFVLIKRSLDDTKRPGEWDFAGGNVSFGELHDLALRREIREEVGIKVDEITPLQVISNFDESMQTYYLTIFYTCKAKSTDIVLSFEHSDFCWASKEQALELLEQDWLKAAVNCL